jgi:hypothetical protein
VNASTRTVLVSLLAALTFLTTRLVAQEHDATGAESGKAATHSDAGEAHATPTAAPHGGSHGAESGHDTGPVPPDPKIVWPWLVLWGILILFLLAAVIGPLSRMHAPPEEPPPVHSHDEPPGASHHHGASGTINPEPDHGHASGHGHH